MLLVILVPGARTLASDGAIELNQVCATSTGCLPGDVPGFPITIAQRGSYVLTSILTPPDINTTGIRIQNDFVALDLHGFGIDYPGTGCLGVGTCPAGTGRGIDFTLNNGNRVSVRNGYVRGAGSDGIQLRNHARVVDVFVVDNAGNGITLANQGLVERCQVTTSGGNGVQVGLFSLLTTNVINLSGLAGSGVNRVGGRLTGGSSCDDDTCSAVALRSYYLTNGNFDGSQPLTACTLGFHMASITELSDLGTLHYDTTLGLTNPDSGLGAPGAPWVGWVRTGFTASSSNLIGQGNCLGWTQNAPTSSGTWISLSGAWALPAEAMSPWVSNSSICASLLRVWCIED